MPRKKGKKRKLLEKLFPTPITDIIMGYSKQNKGKPLKICVVCQRRFRKQYLQKTQYFGVLPRGLEIEIDDDELGDDVIAHINHMITMALIHNMKTVVVDICSGECEHVYNDRYE